MTATHPHLRYHFTMRERQVMRGVDDGMTYGQIAAQYGIGYATVVTYAKQVAAKLGLNHLPPKSAIRQFLKSSPF